MARLRLLLAAPLLIAVACGTPGVTGEETRGIWILESFSSGGSPQAVEVDVNTAQLPWVDLDETVQGQAGCNRFGAQSVEWSNGRLFASEVSSTAMYCGLDGDQLMRAEFALTGALTDPAGVDVNVDGNTMTWRSGNIELVFRSAPEPPPPTTSPPAQSAGRLDCSPGHVVETFIDHSDRDTEQILREEVPEVVRTEEDLEFAPPAPPGWFWLGYDGDDKLIAFIARGDVEPPQYQLFTCSEG